MAAQPRERSNEPDAAPTELRGVLAAAVTGGFAAIAYATGLAVLSLRYKGFGLAGDQGVGITAREQLLIRGGTALLLWAAIGAALFLVVEALPERWLRERPGRAVVIALVLSIPVLIAVLHVFWPLLALLVVLFCLVLADRIPHHRWWRMIMCALAVACVAVVYESSRLSFGVEWATVELENPASRAGGVLISQTERGVYIGDPSRPGRRLALLFVPARRVVSMTVTPLTRTVDAPTAVARRVPIRDRIWHALGG